MKKMEKFLTLCMCVMLAFGVLLVCGTAAQAAEGRTLKIGMIIKEPSAPFIQAFVKGAQERADELGDVEILIRDGEANSIKIMEIIDTFISQKIDAFILAGAVDLRALIPGIVRLNEENIPVGALDTSPEGGKVDFFLSFDLAKSSAKAAELFIEGIKQRNGGEVPEGVVVEIIGDAADMFAVACTEGFSSVLGNYPQLQVVQGEGKWNNTDSHTKASDLITRYGDRIKGIYVQTPDIMAAGVVSAIEAAGLNAEDFGICGICIGPEGIELIKQKKVLGIVEQPAYDSAYMVVGYLVDILKGNPVPKIGETIAQEGALWSPAAVIENPWADEGAFIVLNSPLVPQEAGPDDERLWENKVK
ncbi:MAG: sugar ABC transporter substrate-binding protein [Synergistaceae bacterium]|jgi:ribose transport system substrate-binding protein|nr:sugar ABC transporter substrate-binding protein [Synergistaceae bacterium]